VSEAAPGLPDSLDFATPERGRLAEAVRALIDAVMTTEGDDPALLLDVAAEAERLAARLGGGRDSGAGYRPRSHGDYLPRSPVVGQASPLAPRIEWEESDAAIDGQPGIEAHGTFGAPYEGPPGYVHGGIVALAFDEVLGIANIAAGHPGMTGRLTVRYLKPTPLHRPVELDGRVDRVEGRRIVSKGELRVDGVLTAEAEGLFVTIDPRLAAEYFGREAAPEAGGGRPE
jgi:acyl-coenzyme A thioesterase PaaI-like protein